jgi:hypothetical protein
MGKNQGTLVTAPIRPNDAGDPIATGFANEIAGGHHHYPALTDKADIAIIRARRRWGMLCTIADGTYKLLKPDPQEEPETNIMDNAYWVKVLGNEYVDREILNLGDEGSYPLYVGKNEDGNHEFRNLRLVGGLTAFVNIAGELVIEAPEPEPFTLNAVNLGDGANVFRNIENEDTLRFRSLVAGSGVQIEQNANFILISADGGGAGGNGQGLSQTEEISIGQGASTSIVATSIVAVYEKVVEVIPEEEIWVENLSNNIVRMWTRAGGLTADQNVFNLSLMVSSDDGFGNRSWLFSHDRAMAGIDYGSAKTYNRAKIWYQTAPLDDVPLRIRFGFSNTAHPNSNNMRSMCF